MPVAVDRCNAAKALLVPASTAPAAHVQVVVNIFFDSPFLNHSSCRFVQMDCTQVANCVAVAFNLLEGVLEHGRDADGVKPDIFDYRIVWKPNHPFEKTQEMEGMKTKPQLISAERARTAGRAWRIILRSFSTTLSSFVTGTLCLGERKAKDKNAKEKILATHHVCMPPSVTKPWSDSGVASVVVTVLVVPDAEAEVTVVVTVGIFAGWSES